MTSSPTFRLLVGAVLVTASLSGFATFRGEDWLELETGLHALAKPAYDVWLGLDGMGLYRPVTNLYHGTLHAAAGLRPLPHFAMLWIWFALSVLVLVRVAALRGAPPGAALLVAGAAAVQLHTFQWSLLWLSTTGRALATLGWLVALLLHHVAVDRARRGLGFTIALVGVALAFGQGLLAKEEAIILAPLAIGLEALRWRRLGRAERRAARFSIGLIAAIALGYVVFRFVVVPQPIEGEGSAYRPSFGWNWIENLAFLGGGLSVLPVMAALGSIWLYPAAWTRAARQGVEWERAREAMLGGFGWAALTLQPYLPLGQHSYGYLYVPALGIAFAVAHGLHWAASVPAARGPAKHPAILLGTHGALALAAVVIGLYGIGWPTYRSLTRDAVATLRAIEPDLSHGARIVFVDPMDAETISGRSLFNMAFDNCPGSMARLTLGRHDLEADLLTGREAMTAARSVPSADVVLLARSGRLSIVKGPDRAKRDSPAPRE